MRATIFLILISLGCKGQDLKSDEMLNAKWSFYSYSSTLTGYVNGGTPINPLICQINTTSIKRRNADTTEIYFSLFFKDTANVCMFKPYDLVGIKIIEHKLYVPIYHLIVFDNESKGNDIDFQERKFRAEILKNKDIINSWLYNEAVRRGVIRNGQQNQ